MGRGRAPMLNDWLDRIREVIQDADTNDWIAAVLAGVIVQVIVLLLFRVIGIFFRMASWVMASAISIVVALYILDRQGIPHAIGGRQVDEWIDDARRWIGI
jgi:sugar phosphate permease